jgi:hypothetical protein
MHSSLTATRESSGGAAEMLSRQARLERESESTLDPTPLIFLRQPSLLRSIRPGEVRIDDLRGFLQRYEACIEDAFAFPFAHELAHLYLGRVFDTHVVPHTDEEACDCAAARHMQAIGRANDGGGLFRQTLLKAIEAGDGKYLGELFDKDSFTRRMKILAGRKCPQ